jgi:succinate dehydrogenase / fumarate reductase cytochrome b subunit
MAALDRPVVKPRPVYLNLLAIRQPLAAVVSILHRISGALLFAVGIPVLLWAVQRSLASPETFARWQATMAHPLAKLVVLGLAWAYIHHLLAGIRHLTLDLHVGVDLPSARRSATVVFVLALLLTLIVAVRLW